MKDGQTVEEAITEIQTELYGRTGNNGINGSVKSLENGFRNYRSNMRKELEAMESRIFDELKDVRKTMDAQLKWFVGTIAIVLVSSISVIVTIMVM